MACLQYKANYGVDMCRSPPRLYIKDSKSMYAPNMLSYSSY
jgi:hypothetical protein